MSSDETNNYWAAYFIVSDALSLCLDKLLSHENKSGDPTTRGTFHAARLNLETNRELMQTIRFRFNDGRLKIFPPNTEVIRSLAMGSAMVTGLAADPARIPEVMPMISEIFTQFQSLHEL